MKTLIKKSACFVLSLLFICLCSGCTFEQEETPVLVQDAVLGESRYRLGDTMGDYTVTDINGVSHSFSEILTEKKAIVLNFWFINCAPCRIEFPYLDEAYGNCQEDIEVLAINCVGETAAEVAEFAAENKLSFPVVAGDTAWESAMGIMGYPTTVVIDRFGTVSMIHTGYLDSTDTFNDIFEFFTAEDYTPTIVENISDIQ